MATLYFAKIAFFTPFDYSSFYKKYVNFEIECEFEVNECKNCSGRCLQVKCWFYVISW